MTRAERAAEKVRKEKEKLAEAERLLKDRLAEQREEMRKAQALLREETRKADARRRYYVGALAQEAGLFTWSNSDIQAVFTVLARLASAPNPAGLLEGLLGENEGGVPPQSEAFDDLDPRSSYQRLFLQALRPEGENSELLS